MQIAFIYLSVLTFHTAASQLQACSGDKQVSPFTKSAICQMATYSTVLKPVLREPGT